MAIHKNNIEAYLLDYLEGNLDPLLTAELMAFLAENPGYENWLPDYGRFIGQATGPTFDGKSLLKKNFCDIPAISGDNFDEFCIAASEDLLQESDIARLKDHLSRYPEKEKDYLLYQRLKLKADTRVIYPDKGGLKKPVMRHIRLRYMRYAFIAAASIALILMLVSRKSTVTINTGPLPYTGIAADRPVMTSPVLQNTEVPEAEQVIRSRKNPPAIHEGTTDIRGHLAVSSDDYKLQPLVALKPLRDARIHQGQYGPPMRRFAVPVSNTVKSGSRQASNTSADEELSALKFVGSVMKRLNFWKAAETAITGFNYLTESQLSLSKTMDNKGNLTGLSLNTEEYIISGNKIK